MIASRKGGIEGGGGKLGGEFYRDGKGVVVEVRPVHVRGCLDLLPGQAGDAGELHGSAQHSHRLRGDVHAHRMAQTCYGGGAHKQSVKGKHGAHTCSTGGSTLEDLVEREALTGARRGEVIV